MFPGRFPIEQEVRPLFLLDENGARNDPAGMIVQQVLIDIAFSLY